MQKQLTGLFFSFLIGVCFALPSQAKGFLDGLLYPQTAHKQLKIKNKYIVYSQLTPQPFYQVLPHYLKLLKKAEWTLVFPQKKELEVWISALEKSKEPPVFMLNLYNAESKVNYNLTLGAVSHTSISQPRTIITIYRMSAPFGKNRGGRSNYVNG